MPDLPSGTVSFLFTDIEGSTALWERDRAAMHAAVERHLALLRTAIEAHGGVLFKTVGDAVQAAFSSAPHALAAAVAAQQALVAEAWPDPLGSLQIRMALHAGEAEPDGRGDYLAAPLNRLSRLLVTGHGGQILVSQTVQQLVRGALPEGTALRDLGAHRLRDLLEPERVFQVVHPELPAEFPPLQSLEARPTNLPRQPTPFLGREHEVGEIVTLLRQPEVQLLTLTGPGGTGKTRLALQAATEVAEQFADGVVFIPLAALADPALVLPAIASAVGVREEGGQTLIEQLAVFLASKHLLLVIDNWEHLLEGAAVLGELLRAAPGLTVLATSRAPLHLQAEREYPVPPLALPRRQPPPTLDQLSQYEAVRLFIVRAQAVKPDFAIDNANAPAVAEICHRLDGLPLAIELAAARIRFLPPQAMLTRLEQRLPLLTGGARDAPARQHTLRQTIAWSYDLLSPEEQTLFRRLAVFSGGLSFEAAESVTNPDGDVDVFAGLERLCEQSLLRQEEGKAGEPRFTMLETIREFGVAQLMEQRDETATRERHAAYFLALAETAELHLHGVAGDQAGWFARIDAEFTNLRAAITWFLAQHDGTRALRVIVSLEGYLGSRFHEAEVRPWIEKALTLAPDAPPHLLAEAYSSLSVRTLLMGDGAAALAAAQEALVQAEVTGDPFAIGRTLLSVSTAWEKIGERERLREALERAVPYLRQSDRRDYLAFGLSMLGQARVDAGELAAAQALLDEALSIYAQIDDHLGQASALAYRGNLARAQADYPRAVRLAAQAIAVAHTVGEERTIMFAAADLANVMLRTAQPERAARVLGAIAAKQEATGYMGVLADIQVKQTVTEVRAALEEGVFSRAWEAGRLLAWEDAVREALAALDPEAPVATPAEQRGW